VGSLSGENRFILIYQCGFVVGAMPSCLNAARLEKSEQRPVSPESQNERIGCALATTAIGIMNLSAKTDEIKAEKRAIAAPSHIVAPKPKVQRRAESQTIAPADKACCPLFGSESRLIDFGRGDTRFRQADRRANRAV
jgi:hypothetical protein